MVNMYERLRLEVDSKVMQIRDSKPGTSICAIKCTEEILQKFKTATVKPTQEQVHSFVRYQLNIAQGIERLDTDQYVYTGN